MREDHQKERSKGEVKTETGEALKGPRPHNLPIDKRVLSEAAPGEERTPDMPIGQVAHADRSFQLGEDTKEDQLDESKRGREPGNEMSANTDPTKKKTGGF